MHHLNEPIVRMASAEKSDGCRRCKEDMLTGSHKPNFTEALSESAHLKRGICMIRLLGAFCLLFIAAQGSAQEIVAGVSLDRLDRLETHIQRDIDNESIPGAVTLITRRGEVVYSKALGMSDFDRQVPMTEDRIFYIQSMTKPIISVALMMLYEEGHFLLDDPVSDYLPEFAEWEVVEDPDQGRSGNTRPLESAITIRQLLTHTSGMTHGLGPSELDQQISRDMRRPDGFATVQERLSSLMEFPLFGQPGEQWQYSFSPDVMSVLIEEFSGMSTADFLESRIFEPLGMTDTGYNLSDDQLERIAPLHIKNDDGTLMTSPRQQSAQGNTLWSGVNGLWSTAGDYMRFSLMMLNGGELDGARILGRKTVEMMTSNHVGDLFREGEGWGFGLGYSVVTESAEAGTLVSTGTYSWGGAYNTAFFIDPQEQLVAVFMMQLVPFNGDYSRRIRQLVSQAIVD